MAQQRLDIDERQAVLHTDGGLCRTTQELAESEAFARVVQLYVDRLEAHDPEALAELGLEGEACDRRGQLLDLLRLLANNPLERFVSVTGGHHGLLARRERLHAFVEGLYDFWRSYDRFMIRHTEVGDDAARPYRTFNETVETLGGLVRAIYRDVVENVTGTHPRVYRQVAAGCEVGVIAVQRRWPVPARYRELLSGVSFVRHLLMYPPLLLDPPMNARSGRFLEVDDNPLDGLTLERDQWLCYPALVGRLTVFVYFHQRFAGLGLSLANLFEVASDEEIAAGPDAIYLFGVPSAALDRFGEQPTVYHDDEESRLLVAAVPLEDRFGYFGYLKKMVLTLHNVAVMKRGLMPFHGAFARIALDGGRGANVLIIGDTATGKSETLEALRVIGDGCLRELRVIADDMGSLEVAGDGGLRGYGTEIGAFVRLDDLQQGYAFGRLDRSIIMAANRVNARVVLPVTTLAEVLHGHSVDLLLYANNHEPVDGGHPVIERFAGPEDALAVFREGAAMSKGTTTSTGLDERLLRQPVRGGPARGGARGYRHAHLRRGLRRRPVRGAAPHAPRHRRLRYRRPARGRRRSSRPHRRPTGGERRPALMSVLYESHENAWPLLARGKVRDVYEYGPNELLIVTSDRLSAFDVVLPTPIPEKGVVLTQISNFWFARTAGIVPNHLIEAEPFATDAEHAHLAGRSVVVHRAQALPVEAIVRGYLTGSGRKDYERTGAVCGIRAAGRPRRGQSPAGADLHAVDQGRAGCPRREHRLRRRRRSAGRGARGEGARHGARALPGRRRATPSSAASSLPTPSSSSGCSTTS